MEDVCSQVGSFPYGFHLPWQTQHSLPGRHQLVQHFNLDHTAASYVPVLLKNPRANDNADNGSNDSGDQNNFPDLTRREVS